VINECNSDLTHKEIISEVVRYLNRPGDLVIPEFRMPERRRADVLLVDREGLIYIFECKQDYRPRDIAHSVLKYSLWCNGLYLVMNAGNARLHLGALQGNWIPKRPNDYGVYAIDRLSMTMLKAAGHRQIAPSVKLILDETIRKRVERL
jgi:hypothetical protein